MHGFMWLGKKKIRQSRLKITDKKISSDQYYSSIVQQWVLVSIVKNYEVQKEMKSQGNLTSVRLSNVVNCVNAI